jgi:uncharacterized protein (TIGR02466 family)
MEQTVEEMLRSGITAHKEGKVQEAASLYRAILKADTLQPDANHNMGVLALSVNKVEQALQFFKTAFEAAPEIELFWSSYLEACIKHKQFESAKNILEHAKTLGVDTDRLSYFENQLYPTNETINVNSVSPPQKHVIILTEHYQNGRFNEAKEIAVSLTQKFPNYPFGWKVLGAVLAQTGRKSEALEPSQKVVALSPQDVEAHNNLGKLLQELGRLKEAELSYQRALVLKPDFTLTHYEMGNTLSAMGRLEEAVKSYSLAVELKSDFFEALYNLGNTLKALGRLEEAAKSYSQVIKLKPDFVGAHNNLGATLKAMDRLEEAAVAYKRALTLKSDFVEARYNLGGTLKALKNYEEAITHFDLVDTHNAKAQCLECLYANKNYSEFDKRIKLMSASEDVNIRAAAVSAFVAHQRNQEDPYQYCTNPLDFVKNKNWSEYDFKSLNLIDQIIKESDEYQMVWESRTTKFGFQGSNNVFDNPSPNISHLKDILRQAIADYYDYFKSESNILMTSWPRKYQLKGWYNRLLKNGYHTAHIHPEGWISGVVYLRTPAPSRDNEGAIEFSLHGYDLPIIDENYPRKQHRPKKGDIILFPSSLFHRTIPFTTDTERCVIAFDLMPV